MKKITKILLIAVFALLLVGCEKEDNTNKTYKAEIVIEDYGTIDLELYEKYAPKTVHNFVYLANNHFYDGLTFHRIISGFMIQGGDPSTRNAGETVHQLKESS